MNNSNLNPSNSFKNLLKFCIIQHVTTCMYSSYVMQYWSYVWRDAHNRTLRGILVEYISFKYATLNCILGDNTNKQKYPEFVWVCFFFYILQIFMKLTSIIF